MRRPAFVLPLVLMITMALTLTAAYILQRQGTQAIVTRRQVGQYEGHHATRGIADVIDAWMTGGGRYRSFRDRIDGEGRILDITIPDGLNANSQGGDVLRLYVKDAQGSLLADFSGLTGQTLRDAREALDALKSEDPRGWQGFTRVLGPTTVSLAEAPREVLSSIVQAATGSIHDGQGFVTSILKARDQGPVDAQAMNQAVLDADIPPDQQAKLTRMLSAETTFWTLRVDVLRGGDRLVERFEGYLTTTQTPARSSGQSGQSTRKGHVQQLRRVPLE
jgi:hypothetical protein